MALYLMLNSDCLAMKHMQPMHKIPNVTAAPEISFVCTSAAILSSSFFICSSRTSVSFRHIFSSRSMSCCSFSSAASAFASASLFPVFLATFTGSVHLVGHAPVSDLESSVQRPHGKHLCGNAAIAEQKPRFGQWSCFWHG